MRTAPLTAEATRRRRLWQPRPRLCTVCRRFARGFGWKNPKDRQSLRHWFCSRSCQRHWMTRIKEGFGMVDLTDDERAALQAAIRNMGEVMEEIGWNCRLSELTAEQAFALAEVAVDGFQEAMRDQARGTDTEVPF